jgi:hypothetical protein
MLEHELIETIDSFKAYLDKISIDKKNDPDLLSDERDLREEFFYKLLSCCSTFYTSVRRGGTGMIGSPGELIYADPPLVSVKTLLPWRPKKIPDVSPEDTLRKIVLYSDAGGGHKWKGRHSCRHSPMRCAIWPPGVRKRCTRGTPRMLRS